MDVISIVAVVGVVALLVWAWRAQRRTFADEMFAGVIPGLTPVAGQLEARGPVPAGVEYGGEMSVAFNPPRGVAPGLAGTVVDGKPETRDVMATIVDLAARGHLRITVVEDPTVRNGKDWQLHAADPAPNDPLDIIEHELLGALFATGPEVRLSELPRLGNHVITNLQYTLADESYTRGYFRQVTGVHPVRMVWIAAPVLLLAGLWTGAAGALVGAAAALVGGALIGSRTGQRPVRSAEGTALRIQTLGFKRYLETAEAEQFSYEEAAGIFSKYLPWAIVLGVADHWVKVFGDLAARAQADGFDDGLDLVWFGVLGWGMHDAMFSLAMFSAMDGLDAGGFGDPFGDGGGMFDAGTIDGLGADAGGADLGGGDLGGGDVGGGDVGGFDGADSGGWGGFDGGGFGDFGGFGGD